jgi:hypothetical protein
VEMETHAESVCDDGIDRQRYLECSTPRSTPSTT